MNILVTGGAGYIGSHCVRQLVAAGHRPVVLDSFEFGHRYAVPTDVHSYNCNITDTSLVRFVLKTEEIDAVMHFAAYTYVGESVKSPLRFYLNNVVGTLHLLDAMRDAGVNRMIFSSTCATYGIPDVVPISEDAPQAPISPYGQTKLDIENALWALNAATDFRFICFRYFNAAGASADATIGEDHTPETHLIPLAINAVLGRGEPLRIYGNDYPTPDGTCLRDYVHVDDICRAHIAALPMLNHPHMARDYNLGTGNPTSVLQVLNAISTCAGKPIPHTIAPRRPGDPHTLCANATRAQQELNWFPHYTHIQPIVETAWRWHTRTQ